MTTNGREIVRLELKYCEECGGLWLRIENTSGSYCASCEQRLDELPGRAEDNRLRGGTGPSGGQKHEAVGNIWVADARDGREEARMSGAESTAVIGRTNDTGPRGARCGGNIPDPELWIYRGRTISLLRRYFRMSIEVGRLPSLMGGEFFRAHLTYHRRYRFEDAVILVYDMERSLEQLDHFAQQLIAWIVLQEYSQGEAARLLGYSRRTIARGAITPDPAMSRVSTRAVTLSRRGRRAFRTLQPHGGMRSRQFVGAYPGYSAQL